MPILSACFHLDKLAANSAGGEVSARFRSDSQSPQLLFAFWAFLTLFRFSRFSRFPCFCKNHFTEANLNSFGNFQKGGEIRVLLPRNKMNFRPIFFIPLNKKYYPIIFAFSSLLFICFFLSIATGKIWFIFFWLFLAFFACFRGANQVESHEDVNTLWENAFWGAWYARVSVWSTGIKRQSFVFQISVADFLVFPTVCTFLCNLRNPHSSIWSNWKKTQKCRTFWWRKMALFLPIFCVSHGAGQAETSALVAGKVPRCEMLCLNYGPILEYPNSHVGAKDKVREPCI